VSDLSVECPRINLWNYAQQYLIKQKAALSNNELEAEIVAIYPELLTEDGL